MRADEIIIKPVSTEKSVAMKDTSNKYTFIVAKNANKNQIVEAIEKLFEIKPLKCNLINVKGKKKRVRRNFGYRANIKKAIITLKKGEAIKIFEGA